MKNPHYVKCKTKGCGEPVAKDFMTGIGVCVLHMPTHPAGHTPTPWVAELSTIYPQMQDWEAQDNADPICSVINKADAAFIVRAVNAHEELITTLKTLRASCNEALSGEWDRSDDGFTAMIDSINEALKQAQEVSRD